MSTTKASENTKPTEPSQTTQPEEQNTAQETSSEQPPGPTVAGRSDDNSGVSSTTIGIPVAVVVVLVIVVIISVCWFKRRSKSKFHSIFIFHSFFTSFLVYWRKSLWKISPHANISFATIFKTIATLVYFPGQFSLSIYDKRPF